MASPRLIRVFFIIFLGTILAGNYKAFGQGVITLTDKTNNEWIGKSIYYLKDSLKTFTFDYVSDATNQWKFKKGNQDALNFGNTESVYWFKFKVVNTTKEHWLISQLNYNVDTLVLYYKDSLGLYQRTALGGSVPLSKRKYITNIYVFDLPVKSNDTAVFYFKCKSYKAEYPLMISTYSQIIKDRYYNNLLKGLYFGFVLLFMIYNLILYFSTKERYYILYVFYMLFAALLNAEHAGINALIWGDKFHFFWNYGHIITALNELFFVLFTQMFLQTKQRVPKIHFLTKYILIPEIVFNIFLSLIGQRLYATALNQLMGLIVLLLMSIVAVTLYKRGYKPARFYILACSFYFIGVVVFILKTNAILPYNLITTNAMGIGSAYELVMFSLSIADRLRIDRRERRLAQENLLLSVQENEKLVREQNKQLEIKVSERTSELVQSMQQLSQSQTELEEKNKTITNEKERSDALLLNILPYETAQELKEKGKSDAKMYDDVTIMFTDFVDFTKISETMPPQELVTELDYCFRAFDQIIDRYSIEKIKTIGDSYMAFTGLPMPCENHAGEIGRAALDIIHFMEEYKNTRIVEGRTYFNLRIGISSGPVVAGIVGEKKFVYDIWGDSVNTASRMESNSEPGKINISSKTYELISKQFKCFYRGEIPAKNKGLIHMYFVEGAV